MDETIPQLHDMRVIEGAMDLNLPFNYLPLDLVLEFLEIHLLSNRIYYFNGVDSVGATMQGQLHNSERASADVLLLALKVELKLADIGEKLLLDEVYHL